MPYLRSLIHAEQDRLILFVPALLATGIILYFRLQWEPSLLASGLCLLCSCVLTYSLRKTFLPCLVLALFSIIAAGFLLAQLRTYSVTPLNLSTPLNFAHVQGMIESIEQTPKGSKLILRHVSIAELPPEKTPQRISLTLRKYDQTLTAGQTISLRAGLFPPPQPSLPGGFDFARHYYFSGIGAVGYGIPPISSSELTENAPLDNTTHYAYYRHRLTEAIRSHFHEPAGSVAAAFITGQTQAIPDAVNDDMRTAGLYHLLAVSGMNLSVVAGLAFFSFRLLLALIPAVSLRYNIKKWAAAIALLMSYIYLEIAGSPVSAERAFLMVSLIFLAIMLDRTPSPMRSVALSALLILCVTPEAVLSASFQLSYSATAALIASYEWGVGRLRHPHAGIGLRTIALYFTAVMGTSLVAWLGTEPFIIYHFNQFSSYSLLANTLAEPLVSFLLMPLVIAGVLLMPLGLEWLAFIPLQYGVDVLLALAHWVATLPHALWIVPSPSDAGFALITAGLIWLYFWRQKWRFLGIAAAIAGLCTSLNYSPPDIMIGGDGKHIAVRLEEGSVAMIKGRKDSFIAGQWAHASIVHALVEKKSAPLQCDDAGCTLRLRQHVIALPRKQEAIADDCITAGIVIAPDFTLPRQSCQAAIVIDKDTLAQQGAITLRWNGKEIVYDYARLRQGQRPWTPTETHPMDDQP